MAILCSVWLILVTVVHDLMFTLSLMLTAHESLVIAKIAIKLE
jgi:hypothetical protein